MFVVPVHEQFQFAAKTVVSFRQACKIFSAWVWCGQDGSRRESGGGREGGERLAVAPGQETLRACGDCGPVAQ